MYLNTQFNRLNSINKHDNEGSFVPSPVPPHTYDLFAALSTSLYKEAYLAESSGCDKIQQLAYEPIARFASQHLLCYCCPFKMPCGQVKDEKLYGDYKCYKYLCANLHIEPLNYPRYKEVRD